MNESSHASHSALLLINPKSRQGAEALERAHQSLTQRGFKIMTPKFDSPDEFTKLIVKHASDVDLVIVGGGDGSVRSALEGVLKTKLPLAVIPLGTANNFARNLGIVGDVDAACDVLVGGKFQMVDVAEVNGFYFLNVAGLGLSTEVNENVPHDFKKRWGVIAYAVTAYKTWKKSRAHHVTIVCDGVKKKVLTHQLTICNGRHFGNGITISPEATIKDGMLDLVSIRSRSFLQGLGHIFAMWLGGGKEGRGLFRMRGSELEIRTSQPRNIDTDGEILTQTPAHFKVHRGVLKVYAREIAKGESVIETAADLKAVQKSRDLYAEAGV